MIYSFAAFLLLTVGGNILCRFVFFISGLSLNRWRREQSNAEASNTDPDFDDQPAGWLIGWLERLLLSAGILALRWEILAAVIALKSVTRFKQLDDKKFAEYFLVGSLVSVLWAVVISSLWISIDIGPFGDGLHAQLLRLFESP